MDMQTVLVFVFVIATIGCNTEAQQFLRNEVQVASKPAPNDYVRLSEIPFANAVRAISTPPRDYVPIHEPQQDNPPPRRPQPVTNQPAYNQPQTYTNVVPVSLGYNTHSPVQQIPNTPMSFQYMIANDYPNEVYNFLYHTTAGNNAQLQGSIGYQQGNNGHQQVTNGYVQGNNGYQQVNNGYLQGNNEYLQGNNGYIQGNHGILQGNNAYLQGSNGNQQGQAYLQQAYTPNAVSGYQTPVSYMPVTSNNFVAGGQGIKPVPTYNNYQTSNGYNNFRPSVPLGQNSLIDLTNYQNQIPSHRFRNGKSVALTLPSNNNVQYSSGFVPSTMYQYVSSPGRTARMTSADYGQGYSMPNSDYVSGRFQYVNVM